MKLKHHVIFIAILLFLLTGCINQKAIATVLDIVLKATLTFCCDKDGKDVVKDYTYSVQVVKAGDLECTFLTTGISSNFHVVVACKNVGTEAASGTLALDQAIAVTTPTSLSFNSVQPGTTATQSFEGHVK